MDPVIYKEFEKIFNKVVDNSVKSVLEVGAVPTDDSLLCAAQFGEDIEKVGINLDGPYSYKGINIVQGNANTMECFVDNRFDMVICNAMLEHDPYFWCTVAEIKRVTKPGGYIIIGVPGFDILKNDEWNEKFKKVLRRWPFLQKVFGRKFLGMLFNSTATFKLHNYPGDFYRFSPQAMEKVLLSELTEVKISSVMVPPRLIGIGRIASLS